MNREFITKRITDLRLEEDISEYQLSLELGKSKSYINNIACGKTLPSLTELLNICEYFKIEVKDFFDTGNEYPVAMSEVIEMLKSLNKEDLDIVKTLVKRLIKDNDNKKRF